MTIYQAGQVNTTAQVVPDLIVQILPPGNALINGVPTNVLGVVGSASWGPVGSASIGANMSDYARIHGPVQNRKYDMGTAVAAAVLQGAGNFRFVRVTDGTDAAATANIQTGGLTATAKYTGTLGNKVRVDISAGSQAGTHRAVVSLPGYTPEVFDNVGKDATGNAIWVALAAAINNGTSIARGPSEYIVASAGGSVTAPVVSNSTLAGGTDGATGVDGTDLLGTDVTPRTGMYALRNSGASIAMLADCDDSTTWTNQVAYGLSEGTQMIMVGPAGQTIAQATTAKTTAGIDSYGAKLLMGDWVYYQDTVNGVTRIISPQGFVAGLMANLSPEQSPLNKQVFGVVATQRSLNNRPYSQAELQELGQAGIDVISNPVPGGNYFGVRFGRNTSSDASIRTDNYTRMTNYLASTLNAGMGKFVGKLQGSSPNDSTRQQAKATIDSFLAGMLQQGMIDDFTTKCDLTNNPLNRIALGYMQLDVKVRYLSVVESLIVNLEGGQSVTVTRVGSQPA